MRDRSTTARPTAIAVPVCCLALLAAAGGGYSALAKGNSSPTPTPGTYAGTAGVDTISFKVSGSSLTGLSSTFNPAAICGVPTAAEHERFPTLAVENGHFKGSTSSGTGTVTHFSIQGKFLTPTKATGKISGHFTVRSLPPCQASSTFTVKRKGK